LEVPDELIFRSRNLLTIVDGTKKRLGGEATNDAVAAWIKRNMTASTILVQTID
jgi:hypothetical protein